MSNPCKMRFLEELGARFGSIRKLDKTQSLFEIGKGAARVYVRYSKIHPGNRAFYGLRKDDLLRLEAHPSAICFLWNGQREPLLIPFSRYEAVLASVTPAADGQYKLQVFLRDDGTDLYIAQAGRYNVEGNFGWRELENLVDTSRVLRVPAFTHPQMQTIIGSIGFMKGFDIWIPQGDRSKLDWSLADPFECRQPQIHGYQQIERILHEIDVIWLQRGASSLQALFEVEHSTPIYSGLLRLNDIHLLDPRLRSRFYIVANEERHELFARQLNRPTFQQSGLYELCSFLEYANVFAWYQRQLSEIGATKSAHME